MSKLEPVQKYRATLTGNYTLIVRYKAPVSAKREAEGVSEITMDSCSEALSEWARENGLTTDPERISKIHEEARRRWPKLITRRISEIVTLTLKRMKENV